jgi:hypothetical protein
MRSLWRKAVLALAVGLATAAAPAAGSVRIGQVATTPDNCSDGFDFAQMSVAAGTSYAVPSTGGIASWTVTSWRTRANSIAGLSLTMKVFRQVAGLNYSVVGHDGPRVLAPNVVNTFATSPAFNVNPGDILGLHTASNGTGCVEATGLFGDVELFRGDMSNLADGESGDFETFAGDRMNVEAVLDPTNEFTRAGTRRNKKRGIAILTLRVPNPGELVASGKGVKRVSKTVAGPGDVTLKIAAKGKKRRKLNDTGKAKVSPTLTFTPTGGVPSTQTAKVKLRQR